MVKKIYDLSVDFSGTDIRIYQHLSEGNVPHEILVSVSQVDMLIEWLKEAKEEIKSKQSAG